MHALFAEAEEEKQTSLKRRPRGNVFKCTASILRLGSSSVRIFPEGQWVLPPFFFHLARNTTAIVSPGLLAR